MPLDNKEIVVQLSISNIRPFVDHPFEIRDDDAMKETVQSVKEYGVIMPVIVRPFDEGSQTVYSGLHNTQIQKTSYKTRNAANQIS